MAQLWSLIVDIYVILIFRASLFFFNFFGVFLLVHFSADFSSDRLSCITQVLLLTYLHICLDYHVHYVPLCYFRQ